jgi:tRNA(fMet)-specific endonuclease VapC
VYLLDTNTCIYIINHKPPEARQRFAQISRSDLAISSITLFELSYGVHKSQRINENLASLGRFTALVRVLPFDQQAAELAGALRHQLRTQPIGDMDVLIAAHGLSLQAVVVTRNLREFGRVPGLLTENWLADPVSGVSPALMPLEPQGVAPRQLGASLGSSSAAPATKP